jgi:riboflavin kinase/FMN adenylyltransferase
MHVYYELPRTPLNLEQNIALSIGTFDGVHRGHKLLIETLRREAQTRKLAPAVLTFQDMPYCFFRPDACPHLLTLPDEKIQAFAPLNLEHLFIVPFNDSIAQQSARQFADTLARNTGMKLLVVGPDFALGRGREGDVATLSILGQEMGFDVVVLNEKLLEENAPISSTRVREYVEAGQVEVAMRLLGCPFSLSGEVVSGQQLGRQIGVPTINIQPHARKVLPQNGVYAVRAFLNEGAISHRAVLNIGMRPTVNGVAQSIEFHIIGETIETPPQQARLEFIARLRDEQKFPNLDALVGQIKNDIVQAQVVLRAEP